jgi:hypothetical protein
MNITDLAHIADIVAAIGVIGSMIFVGVQVRQSTRSIRSSTLQQQANQWQQYADLWQKHFVALSDPKVAATFFKALAGRDLEPAEYGRSWLQTTNDCQSLSATEVKLVEPMSAIGTKRTSLVALHMSAFGGKADMRFCTANVRL